ncbi:transmembrane protein 107-like [Styela clava]|uniref:transmembrane protein 107-like n=1 Tax=Styela clava TaxID=7725 RepID=UPI0019396619|nr:transmembrane protein 107-like [Styela clava]
MRAVSGLVPTRFLVLIAHLVIVISIFWSRDLNVKACLPINYTAAEYSSRDTELIIGLSITLAFFLVEFGGFIGGVSMFSHTQSLFSIAAHAGASVTLAFFVFDSWSCSLYWWIFAFCSALPAITETIVIIGVLALKKNL